MPKPSRNSRRAACASGSRRRGDAGRVLASSPRPRRRCRRASGASCRRATSPPNSTSGSSRGGVESVRIPIDWGSVQPTRNGAFDWSGFDSQVEAASQAGIEVLPFLSGAPDWAVPAKTVSGAGGAQGAGAPAGQRRRPHRLGRLPDRRGRPLRPERQLLVRTPRRSRTADPQLADLERAELQVLRRQAQPGRIRQAGEDLLRPR